jgi:hypothetical protein
MRACGFHRLGACGALTFSRKRDLSRKASAVIPGLTPRLRRGVSGRESIFRL